MRGLGLLVALAAASDDTLFVMVSAPRSGTEWLRSMLNDHPEICCDGEPLLRLGRVTLAESAGARAAALADTLEAAAANAGDAAGALKPCKKRALARGFKLYVRYRDLAADPDREMRRVYDFLKVDRSHATNASLLVKSVTTPLADMIENWGEVKAQLEAGGWADEVMR
ncbi:hypothetical protein SO694_000661106 [Aureococcus anophagefferens]|uniref:Protein-tyrosine sulfotransferase n=1 Tax=Aureococcus anophagefferens TaxID=44056 RepID=A0ABR1FQK8_AURAN